jgi:hypothetical protein
VEGDGVGGLNHLGVGVDSFLEVEEVVWWGFACDLPVSITGIG